MRTIERMPEHKSAQCHIVTFTDEQGNVTMMELWSYSTHVATWYKKGFCNDEGVQHYSDTIEAIWGWSATTARHLLWFRRFISKRYYHSKWGDCWQGDCSKAKLLKASVYNPARLTLKEVYD